jgi:hypothetical protein
LDTSDLICSFAHVVAGIIFRRSKPNKLFTKELISFLQKLNDDMGEFLDRINRMISKQLEELPGRFSGSHIV